MKIFLIKLVGDVRNENLLSMGLGLSFTLIFLYLLSYGPNSLSFDNLVQFLIEYRVVIIIFFSWYFLKIFKKKTELNSHETVVEYYPKWYRYVLFIFVIIIFVTIEKALTN